MSEFDKSFSSINGGSDVNYEGASGAVGLDENCDLIGPIGGGRGWGCPFKEQSVQ